MNRRDLLKWAALAAAGARIGAAPAATATTGSTETNPTTARSTQMSNVNEVVVRYIAAWNERDAKPRRELIAKTWAENGSYVDAHRHGVGHDAIDALIGTAQEKFPGYQLRLVSGIETHNSYVRFSWAAGGVERAPLYLGGTDFAVVANDGRLTSVTGFVDAAPAPAA
jgi:hypothetical protein